MAYKVVRAKLGFWRSSFRAAQDDTSFDAESYPELDEYLTTMEERDWSVVNTSVGPSESGVPCLFVTLHRPEAGHSPTECQGQ